MHLVTIAYFCEMSITSNPTQGVVPNDSTNSPVDEPRIQRDVNNPIFNDSKWLCRVSHAGK